MELITQNYFKHTLNQKNRFNSIINTSQNNRSKHVFSLSKLKQGIEVFELLSFVHVYHIFIYQATLQLQKKSFSFASSSLMPTQEQ